MDQNIAAVTGVDRRLDWVRVAGDHDTAVRRVKAISVTLHRMFRRKGSDRDLFVLIDDSGFYFVGVHSPAIRETALVSVGIRACLDVDTIGLQDMFSHRLQTSWTINFERNCPARCPSTEDQIRIAGSVIGMQVRNECHFEIAGFHCRNFSVESSGLGAPHNAGSEINKISRFAHNNSSRGARPIGVGHRCPRAEEHYLRACWPLARYLTLRLLSYSDDS